MNLTNGVGRFQQQVFPLHAERFAALASKQSPHTLFLTCSDSRIDPAMMTQTLPGELFVVRNAGNAVPTYSTEPCGEAATIEFAVQVLNVRQIVVCGHSGCGAVAAVRDGVDGLPCLQSWLEHAVAGDASGSCKELAILSQDNVRRQVAHLLTYPFVEAACRDRGLQVIGWYYDIGSGQVWQARTDNDGFVLLTDSDE
jgi:carbonic anhydrase